MGTSPKGQWSDLPVPILIRRRHRMSRVGAGVSAGLWSGVQIRKSPWKSIWESWAEMEGRRTGKTEGGRCTGRGSGWCGQEGVWPRSHLPCRRGSLTSLAGGAAGQWGGGCGGREQTGPWSPEACGIGTTPSPLQTPAKPGGSPRNE